MKVADSRSRHVRRIGVAATATLLLTVTGATPARAASKPSFPACNASTAGSREYIVDAAEVNPTVTHFMSINIAPGTTGERTETLSRVNSVSTTIGASTELHSEADAIFAKVAVTVGFSVQRTAASTDTETTTMRWTFNEPGYYGLYKGTRAVAGSFDTWRCVYQVLPPPYGVLQNWIRIPAPTAYTTFDSIEVGTVRCGDSPPPGTLRLKARLQLGC